METVKTLPAKCAECHKPMASPVACASCNTLYPLPESLDHFRTFGLAPTYEIDPDALHGKFLAISRSVHPDYFGDASEAMQALALQLSSDVNQAYRVLKDPVLRAEYLLEMAGGKSSADDKTVPQDLLNQIFVLQEEIEEAKGSGDTEKLGPLKQDLMTRRDHILDDIREKMNSLNGALVKDEVRKQLNGLKYINNLIEQL